jgi:hypothetical protein
MGASRPFLAACLAGVFGLPVAGLCAPGGLHAPLASSDAPVRPGVKSGHAPSSAPQYGDEPGDQAPATPYRNGARGRTSENGQGESVRSDTHAVQPSRITVHSAVLDTLGSVHDDSGYTGGSDALGLGLSVRILTDAERQAFAVDAGGIMVTGVVPGTGMRAGFHLGDVVLMVDGVDVSSPDQFYKLSRELPHDRPVPVLVRRPGSNLFLPLGAPAHR